VTYREGKIMAVSAPARRPAYPLTAETLLRRLAYAIGAVILVILLAVVVYPSVVLIRNSFSTREGIVTLQNYATVLRDRGVQSALLNSLVVSLEGTIGATILGALLAWIIARTDVPFSRWWRTLLIVPYLIPPFIGAIAWVYLLGPVGYLNRVYMALTGSTDPLLVIYGQAGIVLVMIIYSYPIAYMVNLGTFERTNPALEEAARISGASILHAVKDIALPLSLPSLGASAVLIFLSLMANFGIPAVIGFTARYFVLTTKIYATILNFDQPNNLQLAAAQSMLLVALAIVAMQVQRLVQGRGSYAVVGGQSVQRETVELRWLKAPVVLLLGIIVLVAVIAPLVAILLTALTRAPGLPLTPENITLQHFEQLVFGVPKVRRAVLNSLGLAAASATIIAAVSIVIAYVTVRLRMWGSHLMDALVAVPYAVPGTVVALAMILAWAQPVLGISIYNTMWIILLAYVTRFLTFGVRATGAAFEQIHESLEEAARISGADAGQALKDITIPLIRSSIFAGWFLAFVPALTELTLSILLFSVGNETLGVVVFGLHQEGKVNLTAALAFIVACTVLVLNMITRRVAGRELGF
jgi:iron(III) transport system permease protein